MMTRESTTHFNHKPAHASPTPPLLSEDDMWRAFADKDPQYDGQFFVAVKTTGIYCRPSCSARPLRKNVVFFATWDAAEAAGFRACKRCHPKAAHDQATALAHRAAEQIRADGTARLDQLSQALHISPFHLQRTFKKVMGVSPLQYAKAQRLQQVKHELRTGSRVTDAIYNAGFNSSSGMYEQAGQRVAGIGMTPGTYQKGGRGMTIDYTISQTRLGRMLVAGTSRGLCALYLGDNDAALEHELMKEYPAAAIQQHTNAAVQVWADEVVRYLNQQPHTPLTQLPLDVQGTAFQARVWQALRNIPEGETRSYRDIAQSIGQPSAVRAVANACGANHVAVVIPCHRVVRQGQGNDIGGYRWGAERKAQLLEQELG